MEIKDRTDYVSPGVKVMNILLEGLICSSAENTEGFSMSDHSYDEDEWE